MVNSDAQSSGGRSGLKWAVWAQSAVNGALGDYLHAERNPLAINMALYACGTHAPLALDALAALQPAPTGRIVLLVHGLGCSESMWCWHEPQTEAQKKEKQRTPITSYGHMLQVDVGYTPIAIRYNTGLAIAANGQKLAALIDALAAAWPVPVEEILLIGHSMGGLVIRHACYDGSVEQRAWLKHVQRIIYLGTPHEGADLERFAHMAASTLRTVPNPITRFIGGLINLRSQGVQDLRHGAQHDVGANAAPGEPLPWLRNVQHYLIAGTLGSTQGHATSLLFGDGLVRPPRNPARMGANGETPPETHVVVFPGVHHVGLARSHAVYAQILAWCMDTGVPEASALALDPPEGTQ